MAEMKSYSQAVTGVSTAPAWVFAHPGGSLEGLEVLSSPAFPRSSSPAC